MEKYKTMNINNVIQGNTPESSGLQWSWTKTTVGFTAQHLGLFLGPVTVNAGFFPITFMDRSKLYGTVS